MKAPEKEVAVIEPVQLIDEILIAVPDIWLEIDAVVIELVQTIDETLIEGVPDKPVALPVKEPINVVAVTEPEVLILPPTSNLKSFEGLARPIPTDPKL